jgi:putative lipoic acid-binding regulatory protein
VAEPEPPSLIEYPSRFPIKVMGVNDPGFEQAMVGIALQFDPTYDPASLQVRPSSGGKYLGLTLDITATSRGQLDELYRTLSSHPMVKVVL